MSRVKAYFFPHLPCSIHLHIVIGVTWMNANVGERRYISRWSEVGISPLGVSRMR
jgi:hypothetical protein